MNGFDNAKMATKLIGGFLLIAAIGAAVGIVSVQPPPSRTSSIPD